MATLVSLLLLASPALAGAAHCPGGRFLVSGAPLLAAGEAGTDTIVVGDETVAVASGCDTIPSRRTGNRFRAVSRSCAGSPVRVMARIFKQCGMLRGALRTRRRSRRFAAMRVPYDFVQPFDIDFRYEDRHVIAFFDGHPEYEAVEAFLAERSGQGPLIRAILTRHDKTQVDLLNDEAVLETRRAANPSREAYFAPITFSVTVEGGNPRVLLAFVSHRGEAVLLDVRGTTPALAVFGGLTDPQGHAPDVLPILWRDASAVADVTSSVTVDGQPYTIPPFLIGSAQLGLDAFYTEGFAVGIIAAGQRRLQLLEAPAALAVGARWEFADRVYEIMELGPDRAVIRRTSGVPETIEAVVRAGRLYPTAITVSSGSERPGEMVLAFDPSLPDVTGAGFGRDAAAAFTIAVNGHGSVVDGGVVPGDRAFDVVPGEPAWATSRTVQIALARAGGSWTLSSSIPGS